MKSSRWFTCKQPLKKKTNVPFCHFLILVKFATLLRFKITKKEIQDKPPLAQRHTHVATLKIYPVYGGNS